MAKQTTKSKPEIKIIKTGSLEESLLHLNNLQAVELFNLSVKIRAAEVAIADKIAATRNFIALLPIKKQHEEIINTISEEFKKKYENEIAALQTEEDKDHQKEQEQVLMQAQEKHFSEDLLLNEFCKKELTVKLEKLSIEICADEAICSAMMLVTLSDLNLVS